MIAYTVLGALRAIEMPIRPRRPVGMPAVIWVQVVPPFVDFQTALPGPPSPNVQGRRTLSYVAAYRTWGFTGSI
jgi:hypothetical protein